MLGLAGQDSLVELVKVNEPVRSENLVLPSSRLKKDDIRGSMQEEKNEESQQHPCIGRS